MDLGAELVEVEAVLLLYLCHQGLYSMSAFIGNARRRALISVSTCSDPAEASEPLRLLDEGARSEGIPSSESGARFREEAMDVEGRFSGPLPPCVTAGEAGV